MSAPHQQPVPDLLNMKGGDRPTPLTSVTIEQRLNSQLPLDAMFRDETGKSVPLGAFFNGHKPVILALVYYDCPMLCTQILEGTVRAARVLTLKAGEDYDVVAISFDAREGPNLAAAKKAVEMKDLGRRESCASAWHFLTGDVDSIKRVTDAVGFRYVWDAHTAQFAHASAIYVLTPQGRLSRYFYGIEYSARDLRLGLSRLRRIRSATRSTRFCCSAFTTIRTRRSIRHMRSVCCAWPAWPPFSLLGGFVFISLRRDRRMKGSRTA